MLLHLLHPLFRYAPDDGTVGLRNPTSCEPVWVRGNQVFGELFCETTDGIMSTDDSFPDEDFFPNISALYIDDMADDAGANANANANVNMNLNANANAFPSIVASSATRCAEAAIYLI
jgi:hypothetical protein